MTKRGTKELFIQHAREVHGNKYDYSKVEYANSDTKVCIICPKHGDFWQRPYAHLAGATCRKCANEIVKQKRRYTFDEFVRLSRLRHGKKYDYSKADYVNSRTEVCITCPQHGDFWQNPTNHIGGAGCPVCSGSQKVTTDEFIRRAREVHGDKYDYSKTDYKNNKDRVQIICPQHGPFWQFPTAHTKGAGCPECGKEKRKVAKLIGNEEFIRRARIIHGDKFDYSKVNYINCEQKVCIVCPQHGIFWQAPMSHLSGRACPACSGNKRLDETGFYEGARKFHGDKYDYSKVVFHKSTEKVCIICPKHGEFWQTPNSHAVKGHGCFLCASEEKAAAKKISTSIILEEATKYKSLKELNDKNPAMYALANKRKLDLSFLQRSHHTNYTREEILELAHKCKYSNEFQRRYGGAYNRAREMGLLDEMDWFEIPKQFEGDMNARNHCVYAYEDVKNHTVYIGLTNNIIRRHHEHSHAKKNKKNSKVFDYFSSIHIPVPQPKILAHGLTPAESREVEDVWLKKYKQNGWTIINVAKTGARSGSLGSYVRKWTIESVEKEAAKYKTKAEFERASPTAYEIARKKGILKKLGIKDVKPARRAVRNIDTGEVFASLAEASRKYGVSSDTIGMAARGKTKTGGGYHWTFIENDS